VYKKIVDNQISFNKFQGLFHKRNYSIILIELLIICQHEHILRYNKEKKKVRKKKNVDKKTSVNSRRKREEKRIVITTKIDYRILV
jgi:cytoskeletal protein RodZ